MAEPAFIPRRTRRRRQAIRFADEGKEGSQDDIANRVTDFFRKDIDNRTSDIDLRLQRHAKYRQWVSGKEWPWENSSDVAIPDMTEDSLRQQDTLHNAVMAFRPIVTARALNKQDKEKERIIDTLTDAQFFEEQPGEKLIEEMTEQFVNEGTYVNLVAWVREDRKHVDVRVFEPIPVDQSPREAFLELLNKRFPDAKIFDVDDEGWDYRIEDKTGDISAKFYTTGEKDDIELVTKREMRVYDGPRVFCKAYAQVVTPPRVANLQIPSPSNPGGSPHVILVDHPTIEEIKSLQKSGFYDLLSDDDLDKLNSQVRDDQEDEQAREGQVDAFAGKDDTRPSEEVPHKTLTRLMCFDIFDVDNDGIGEDVIWWVILEGKKLLKAAFLTEMYPFQKPRRPLAEATFLPVKDRREGISLLELTEGLHDLSKMLTDMTIDTGMVTGLPFGFYRPTSGLNPEVIRVQPLDLIPLNDPRGDVHFPTINNTFANFGINMLALVNQSRERLTLQGDLQAGRVPTGKASALRTLGGIQTILAQGEARPERILRRFFMGLTDTFRMMHELNRKFLPDNKKFRIAGMLKQGEDPYTQVEKASEVDVDIEFSFGANVQNASKLALQASLDETISLLINPLTIELGLVSPDSLFRLLRDKVESLGQKSVNYLQEPTPGASEPRILAEDAIDSIFDGRIPQGLPMEGAAAQLERISAILDIPAEFLFPKPQGGQIVERFKGLESFFDGDQMDMLRAYMRQLQQLAAQEKQQQRLLESAQQFQQGQQQGGAGVAGQPPVNTVPQLQSNELSDESLPGAGGGANQGP